MKPPIPEMIYIKWSYGSKDTPKQPRVIAKLYSANWYQGPIAEESIHATHWILVSQAGASGEVSLPID